MKERNCSYLNLSPENIAEVLIAAQEKSFPVYRGPNCLSIPKGIRYVKGEVTQEERERFRSHIRTCLYCSRRIESLRRTAERIDEIEKTI